MYLLEGINAKNVDLQCLVRVKDSQSKMSSNVIVINSVEQGKEQLEKANESKKLVVVNFTATWCGPCRMVDPFVALVAEQNPEVVFLKVDVDDNTEVSEEWGIKAMPTILFIKEGKKVDIIVGSNKDELEKKIKELA